MLEQRMDFQELMRERFDAVIESATGWQMIGFMSVKRQDPHIICEVWILARADLGEGAMPDPGSSAFERGGARIGGCG